MTREQSRHAARRAVLRIGDAQDLLGQTDMGDELREKLMRMLSDVSRAIERHCSRPLERRRLRSRVGDT